MKLQRDRSHRPNALQLSEEMSEKKLFSELENECVNYLCSLENKKLCPYYFSLIPLEDALYLPERKNRILSPMCSCDGL